MIKAFLSHTGADKDLVRLVHSKIGAEAAWFDAVDISTGDMIPEKISEGLRIATHFVLFWSEAASRAPWVRAEMNAAFVQNMADKCKFMIFKLDETDLPELFQPFKYNVVPDLGMAEKAQKISDAILSQEGAITRLASFVNRTSEIGDIEEAARAGNKLIILHGMLGIGKSSLAERTVQWLYPNRFTSRIILDFSSIPGLAELALVLARQTKKDLINDNKTIQQQQENIRYFFECISAANQVLIIKDVKSWLDEDGCPNEWLGFVCELIILTSLFKSETFMTSSRYIELPQHYYEHARQIHINGMSDIHIAEIIHNNLPQSFVADKTKNREFAKRLYGYPLGAKLAAYRISNTGYDYYLSQPQKIHELKVGLAKELISYAGLSEDCHQYLQIVALSQSRLRNEELCTAFPKYTNAIGKLCDEAFFAGVLKFDADQCYKLEPLVEDYYYDMAFNSSKRRDICKALEEYLLNVIQKKTTGEQYFRLVPATVHILTLNGKVKEAIALRAELTSTISSSMWDQYNHRDYENALSTAEGLLTYDDKNTDARYIKALCLMRFEKYTPSEEILRDLMEDDVENIAQYYYGLGRLEHLKRNYKSAIEYYQIATTKRKRYLSPFREMAKCYIQLDDLPNASKAIENAKHIDPSNVFILLEEVRILLKQHKEKQALRVLSEQIIMEQAPYEVCFSKGRAHDLLGEQKEAMECYREALIYGSSTSDAKLCILSHQVIDEPDEAEKEIAFLKPKLHGKRQSILKNIEARFIGYHRHDEEGAIAILDSVPIRDRDKQWHAVRYQLLENLIPKQIQADRTIMAGESTKEFERVKEVLEKKYGDKTIVETDFIPEA